MASFVEFSNWRSFDFTGNIEDFSIYDFSFLDDYTDSIIDYSTLTSDDFVFLSPEEYSSYQLAVLAGTYSADTSRVFGTIRNRTVWNEFDEHALLTGVSRLSEETNWEIARRTRNAYAYRANSTYNGLINGITNDLGLDFFYPLEINPISSGNSFLASDPYIEISGAYLCLYSNYENNTLDYKIDLYQQGNNFETLKRLSDFINTTEFFYATLNSTYNNIRSATLCKQNNRKVVDQESIPVSTKFKLKNSHIVSGTLFFSNRNIFKTEVLTTPISSGEYLVDYDQGIITVYSIPTQDISARYQYISSPFKMKASPVILNSIVDEDFQPRLFTQMALSDGTTTNGIPTGLGVDLINEILSVYPNYYGE